MLTAGLIRDNLQAHLALARVGEQPPSSAPTSLPVWTTRGSHEPAVGPFARFRFGPAEQERGLRLEMLIAYGGTVATGLLRFANE